MAIDARNLYVWGVPGDITETEFRKLFEGFGPVESTKICAARGPQTYGFITFFLRESAQAATLALNNTTFKGRAIQVKMAEPGRMGETGAGYPAASPQPAAASTARSPTTAEQTASAPVVKVYVSGMPERYDQEALRRLFERFGEIQSTRVLPSKQKGWTKYGFVNFATLSSAHKAINALDGATTEGAQLQVRLANNTSLGPAAAVGAKEKPAGRISDDRFTGTVHAWKGRYGWITPDSPIDHPEAKKHRGQVYVHANDVEGYRDATIAAGDRVSFVLYADHDGVGGEEVRIIQHGGSSENPARPEPPPRRKKVAQSPEGVSPKPASAVLPASWWHALEGDCCPISLTPLEELECEPFGLLGSADDMQVPDRGIWGASARSLLLTGSKQVVHWSDGMFLACSLVANAQILDPVNMRPLSGGECESLDQYLEAHGFQPVHVGQALALSEATDDADAARQLASLSRSAASMLMIMFDEGSSVFCSAPAAEAPAAAGGNETQRTEEPAADDSAVSAKPKRRWGRKKGPEDEEIQR
eukprot:TRINITY_DN6073_c4_g1_i1.p1 TRINITY_DN6073_c4_g1~~TRINITY_DN6073_c4_g1_i1.p1  ORF type:complete len:539 (-),score=96.10 TRINITY_DN6073_c4_g1_i1:7-1602(-)